MARRLFIAVDVPADVKEVLQSVHTRPHFHGLRVRWAPPEQLHLTLVFLGATEEGAVAPIGEAMRAAAAGCAPFRLSLGALGAFPGVARPKVVWCGVDGDIDALRQLRTTISSAVAAIVPLSDAATYTPHLTVGRVRRDAQAAERRMIGDAVTHAEGLPHLSWLVDQVVLYESVATANGMRHVPLLTAPLHAATL